VEVKTIPLPEGLPAPVERYYRTVYGEQIPVIDTVVIAGRGRIRPFGVWFPALWLTDPRAQWEAVDEHTVLLRVPFEDGTETFVVRFNPETGLLDMTESMRFKGKDVPHKTLWITSSSPDGKTSYATWLDDGKPWAELKLGTISFNSDVREYIRARWQ